MTDSFKAAANKQTRDEKKEARLRRIFGYYTEQFRAVGNQAAPAVAREAHIAIDDVLERDRRKSATSGDIKCRKGCDHCCRVPVEIWPHEAALLAELSGRGGVAGDEN